MGISLGIGLGLTHGGAASALPPPALGGLVEYWLAQSLSGAVGDQISTLAGELAGTMAVSNAGYRPTVADWPAGGKAVQCVGAAYQSQALYVPSLPAMATATGALYLVAYVDSTVAGVGKNTLLSVGTCTSNGCRLGFRYSDAAPRWWVDAVGRGTSSAAGPSISSPLGPIDVVLTWSASWIRYYVAGALIAQTGFVPAAPSGVFAFGATYLPDYGNPYYGFTGRWVAAAAAAATATDADVAAWHSYAARWE